MNTSIFKICFFGLLLTVYQNFGQEVITGENIAVTNTESGKVRGYINDGTYVYKGIPYAKAERFMAPTKADSWEGVRSSTIGGRMTTTRTST